MKVKDAIIQLQTMCPEAELVVELDEFPNHYCPVVDFLEAKAGDADRTYFPEEYILEGCRKRIDLPNVRSVVVCETQGI